MTKYCDCIGTEIKVGDSVVYAGTDGMNLSTGTISYIGHRGDNYYYFTVNPDDSGYSMTLFKGEICYINTLDELGE